MNFNERNPHSVSSLLLAVELNDINAVRNLIKKGRSLNITDNRGWTPLHEAAALGHLECLTVLLKAGARIDVITHQGETPFFIACKYNRMEIVKTLLNWDSTLVNTSNNESVTPLHISCTDHNLILAQFLILKQANINAEDNSGLTPLQEAVMREDLEICKLLLENGANVNSREYDGHSAFHFACTTGNIDILKVLIDFYKGDVESVINSGNCCGFTPIMLAVQSKCLNAINELLNLGADVNIADKSNTLALHLAFHTGDLTILQRIFKITSPDVINKYCTNDYLHQLRYANHQKSLVCLVIDSESVECLQYTLNCGLNSDILNCCIVESEVLPPFFDDMRNHALFGPHRNIIVEVNISDLRHEVNMGNELRTIMLHPMSFLLKQKMSDLGNETVKYLQIMCENGFTFDCNDYNNINLLVMHPYEAMMFCYQSNGRVSKEIIIDCLRLMIEFGISVDYVCNTSAKSIPILFVYACRAPLLEMIPYLLQSSNLIDLDDILQWVVHKMFMRIDPPPHKIEKALFKAYNYLTKYTPKSVINFVSEIRKPEYESRFNCVMSFINNECAPCVPSLKIMCRSVIRNTIKGNCSSCPHQLRVRLNNLELPSSLLAFLNYNDMLESSTT